MTSRGTQLDARPPVQRGHQGPRGAAVTGVLGKPFVTPVALGFLGFLATFAGSWIPSYWGDEAASVLSAERSLPSLFRLLGNVDAVHGTYYLFLHFWIGAFGSSELATRLPSAIAAGLLVAGTFRVADLLGSRQLGVIAALICAVLPRVSFFGGEARSYALSSAAVVWLTVVLIQLLQTRETRRRRWIGYAVLLALGIWLFLYVALIVPVHLLYVLAERERRAQAKRYIGALLVAFALAIPLLVFAYRQRSQISFLSTRRHLNWRSIVVYQWLGNTYLALLVWALIVFAVVIAAILWRRGGQRDDLVILAVLWLLLPMLALFAIGIAVPTYDIRYLSLGTPAVALLAAAGIRRLRPGWLQPVLLVAVLALAIPTDVGQREPNAYNVSSDWSAAARIVGARAQAGDAIVFDGTARPSQRPRLAYRLYPASFAGLVDVELKTPFTARTRLWDSTYALSAVTGRLAGVKTVWLLALSDTPDFTSHTTVNTLLAQGYTQHTEGKSGRMIVYRFTRAR